MPSTNQRVVISPGQTALTRISGASARARYSVIELTAPLEAMYGTDEPMPSAPAIDETLTIAPPAALRWGTQARTIWKVPSTLTPRMRWKTSASSASQFAEPVKVEIPALLTSASRRPHFAIAACARARQSASTATSPCTSSVLAPASRQAAAASFASRSLFE